MSGEYSATVGKQVQVLRRTRDITQERVAVRMRSLGHTGWLRQTVGQVERGKRRLVVDEVLALSLVLGVPITDLLPEPPSRVTVTVPISCGGPEFQRYMQQAVQEAVQRYGRGAP